MSYYKEIQNLPAEKKKRLEELYGEGWLFELVKTTEANKKQDDFFQLDVVADLMIRIKELENGEAESYTIEEVRRKLEGQEMSRIHRPIRSLEYIEVYFVVANEDFDDNEDE